MPRFKLILEYDGAPYVGWRRRENGVSIQETLEAAIFAMTGEEAVAHGAGRTDAGVHAAGQAAHLDLRRDWAPFRLSEGLNAHLVPSPIAVLEVERAADDFDARRSARGRFYVYRVVKRRARIIVRTPSSPKDMVSLELESNHCRQLLCTRRHQTESRQFSSRFQRGSARARPPDQ